MSVLDRRTVLRGAALSGLAATVAPTLAWDAAARPGRPGGRRPPNVVVISIDDLGWDELGCYGNTFNETPRIDAIAQDGIRFTAAYAAAPLCSPTRAALVTGRYPVRTGITDYLRGEGAASAAFLSPAVPTVPDVLGPLGYTTGLIGKWHLTESYSGPYAERPGNPYAHGFDEVVLSEELYIGDGDYTFPYAHLPSVAARLPEEHLTDRLALEATDFLTRHADAPFFLHLSNYATHTALEGRPDLVAKYEAKPGADVLPHRPQLAAMLESVDAQVGQVVDTLEALGITDDTLLLVTSDNGGPYRDANAPLRGGKGELYEGGIRVPLVARWPGHTARGRTDDTPVSTIDVLPTALDLAGGRPRPRDDFDGVSLAPLLDERRRGRGPGRARLGRDTLFWVYPHYIGLTQPHAAVRVGDLKLVQQLRDGSTELFDLARDPGETTDLAARVPGDERRLRAALERHLHETRALAPAPSASSYPVSELRDGWGDLRGYDVLPGPSAAAPARVEIDADGLLAITATGKLGHVLVRSTVAPSSDRVAAVLETGSFAGRGNQDTVFVGLAEDADTYLLLRYVHGRRRVGWDLRVDGQLVTAGAEPLGTLDGTVDLSALGSRFGFVLRGSVVTAYADQGGAGWEHLFRFDTGGALDLRDPAVRARTRYTAGARLDDGTITLRGLSADRVASRGRRDQVVEGASSGRVRARTTSPR